MKKELNLISKNKLIRINAKYLDPGVLSKEVKWYGLALEVILGDTVYEQLNNKNKNVNFILDLTDSVNALSLSPKDWKDIFSRFDLKKDRINIYSLGESESLIDDVAQFDTPSLLSQKLMSAIHKNRNAKGSFIKPTLDYITSDTNQHRNKDQQQLVFIVSDSEIWDWEDYQNFIEKNENIDIIFMEQKGVDCSGLIQQKIREINEYSNNVSLVNSNNDVLAAFDKCLIDTKINDSSLPIDTILFRLVSEMNPICVIDYQDEAKEIKSDFLRYSWSLKKQTALHQILQRVYFFEERPERLKLESVFSIPKEPEKSKELIDLYKGALVS